MIYQTLPDGFINRIAYLKACLEWTVLRNFYRTDCPRLDISHCNCYRWFLKPSPLHFSSLVCTEDIANLFWTVFEVRNKLEMSQEPQTDGYYPSLASIIQLLDLSGNSPIQSFQLSKIFYGTLNFCSFLRIWDFFTVGWFPGFLGRSS